MFSLKQTKIIRPPPGTDSSQARAGSTTYLYAVTAFASLGAFLFGYDQGVMGVIVADDRWIDLMHPKNSCKCHYATAMGNRITLIRGHGHGGIAL